MNILTMDETLIPITQPDMDWSRNTLACVNCGVVLHVERTCRWDPTLTDKADRLGWIVSDEYDENYCPNCIIEDFSA